MSFYGLIRKASYKINSKKQVNLVFRFRLKLIRETTEKNPSNRDLLKNSNFKTNKNLKRNSFYFEGKI